MMKRWMLLLLAAAVLGLGVSFGEGNGACPVCGSENTERFCAHCGAGINAEERISELTPGLSRVADGMSVEMADALAEKYGIGAYEDMPVYTPTAPQPMNAYMIADRKFEMAGSEGFKPVDNFSFGDVSFLLKEWAKDIADESKGAIRFVDDPDEADLLISVCREYHYYGKYEKNGNAVSGYSCEVGMKACLLSNPVRTAQASVYNSPAETIWVSSGASIYWVDTPAMRGTNELRHFVDAILGWYGYASAEEPDVAAVQRALQARGAWEGPVDGTASAALGYAVRRLQEQYGLAPTGKIGKGTLMALFYDQETVREAADSYPSLLTDYNADKDRVCPSCGWIYGADEDCAFCAHCGSELQAVYIGGILRFGRYEQDNDPGNGAESIEWYVLDIQDGKVLLLSRYGLDAVPFTTDEERNTWETCTLREWLNGAFFNAAFTDGEAADILLTEVDNSKEQARLERWNDGTSDVDDGAPTQDRIFLLTPHELVDLYYLDGQIIYVFPTDFAAANGASRMEDKEDADLFPLGSGTEWTRLTAGSGSWAVCQTSGYNDLDATHVTIRPAMWIRMETPEAASGSSSGRSAAPITEFNWLCPADIYTIHVIDQNGETVQDVTVSFHKDGETTRCSDYGSGLIEFGGSPGNYRIELEDVPAGHSYNRETEMYTGEEDQPSEWILVIQKD